MIKKSLYDIAINNQGYIFEGTPERPSRDMVEAPTYGAVPTEIDFDYSDASSYFPWAQTDWSGGYQDAIWKDNAKYKYGENIDPLKEYGELRLLPTLSDVLSLAAGHTYASAAIWNQKLYVGTSHASKAKLYSIDQDDATVDITVTTGATDTIKVNQMTVCMNRLVMGMTTSDTDDAIQTYDGTSFYDVYDTKNLCRMVQSVGNRLYAGVYSSAADGDMLIYTDDIDGTPPTWVTRLAKFGKNKQVIKGVDYFGILYFLVSDYPSLELWYEDGNDIERIYRWDNLVNPDIKIHNQTVMISGQTDGLTFNYGWNGAQLIPLYEEKETTNSDEATDSLYLVTWKGDLWLQGLRFDGQFWYTGFKYRFGSNNKRPFAAYGHGASNLYFYGLDSSTTKVQRTDETTFPTSGFEISGKYRNKPAITKLWNSADLNFEALEEGESIQVLYSIDNEATWVSLGTANTVGQTSAAFYFASNIKSPFIQRKIILNSDGSSTPVLKDCVFRFLLLPRDRQLWRLAVRCGDNMVLKDTESKEPKYGEELRNLLRVTRWKNSIVDFEDYDYWETAINDATDITASDTTITVDSVPSYAPEQGRFRIDNEEIFYTGKTRTTFTGCTRGARNTVAATHADDATVSTIYKVIITAYKEILPVSNKPEEREYIAQVTLLEA